MEIDCPSSCPHLIAGRSYEAEKRIPDAELVHKVEKYSNDFVYRYAPILDAISRSVVEERLQSPWLVDNDVVEVYKSLSDNNENAVQRDLLRNASRRPASDFTVQARQGAVG